MGSEMCIRDRLKLSSSFRVDERVVDYTRRLMEIAIEISEYWRKTAPLYEVNQVDAARIMRLLEEAEDIILKLKELISFKP